MKLSVDLNADLGEGCASESEILTLISSANISCGWHAGNPASVRASIERAKNAKVAIGAHPSFDDRENFGRAEIELSPAEIFSLVAGQLAAFQELCHEESAVLRHVKPHGALYNMAVRDRSIADAIVRAVRDLDARLILFAPGHSALAQAAAASGLQVAREVFADRNYHADGALVARAQANALVQDPDAAAARVLRILREGKVRALDGADVEIRADTICLHGDTPGAVEFAHALRQTLQAAGVEIQATP